EKLPVAGEQFSPLFDQVGLEVGGHAKAFCPPSWPGLSRPSTSFCSVTSQDVDARHKAGHDALGVSVPFNGLNRRSSLGLRLGLLRDECGLEIVEQFNLHTIAVHDEALLQYRQRIVPC